MKRFIIILSLILFSCNSKEYKIEVYYFQYRFTTPTPVLCQGIYHYSNLKKITIFNKKEYDSLTSIINQLEDFESEYNVDVKRQLIINKDTICFDRFKNILVNGVSKDTVNAVKLYDLVDKLIIKYDNKATIYNKSPAPL